MISFTHFESFDARSGRFNDGFEKDAEDFASILLSFSFTPSGTGPTSPSARSEFVSSPAGGEPVSAAGQTDPGSRGETAFSDRFDQPTVGPPATAEETATNAHPGDPTSVLAAGEKPVPRPAGSKIEDSAPAEIFSDNQAFSKLRPNAEIPAMDGKEAIDQPAFGPTAESVHSRQNRPENAIFDAASDSLRPDAAPDRLTHIPRQTEQEPHRPEDSRLRTPDPGSMPEGEIFFDPGAENPGPSSELPADGGTNSSADAPAKSRPTTNLKEPAGEATLPNDTDPPTGSEPVRADHPPVKPSAGNTDPYVNGRPPEDFELPAPDGPRVTSDGDPVRIHSEPRDPAFRRDRQPTSGNRFSRRIPIVRDNPSPKDIVFYPPDQSAASPEERVLPPNNKTPNQPTPGPAGNSAVNRFDLTAGQPTPENNFPNAAAGRPPDSEPTIEEFPVDSAEAPPRLPYRVDLGERPRGTLSRRIPNLINRVSKIIRNPHSPGLTAAAENEGAGAGSPPATAAPTRSTADTAAILPESTRADIPHRTESRPASSATAENPVMPLETSKKLFNLPAGSGRTDSDIDPTAETGLSATGRHSGTGAPEPTVAKTWKRPDIFRIEGSDGGDFAAHPLERTETTDQMDGLNGDFETPIGEQIEHPLLEYLTSGKNQEKSGILKLRLRPAELGTVEIRLEKDAAGRLEVYFRTETDAAGEILAESFEQLRDSLQNNGWQVERLEITGSLTSSGSYQTGGENPSQSESVETPDNPTGDSDGASEDDDTEQLRRQAEEPDRLVNLRA